MRLNEWMAWLGAFFIINGEEGAIAGSSACSMLRWAGVFAGVSLTADEGRALKKSRVALRRTVPGTTDALEGGMTDISSNASFDSAANASRKRLLAGVALT